jgi:hypothetical protein
VTYTAKIDDDGDDDKKECNNDCPFNKVSDSRSEANYEYTQAFERKDAGHINQVNTSVRNSKGKAIPVTGLGGPFSCETSRLPHFLDNRLIDDREGVSLMHPPPFTLQEDSWNSFMLEAELTPWAMMRLEGLG